MKCCAEGIEKRVDITVRATAAICQKGVWTFRIIFRADCCGLWYGVYIGNRCSVAYLKNCHKEVILCTKVGEAFLLDVTAQAASLDSLMTWEALPAFLSAVLHRVHCLLRGASGVCEYAGIAWPCIIHWTNQFNLLFHHISFSLRHSWV